MRLNSPAIILDLPDLAASRDFLTEHLGFTVAGSGDGFVALAHDDHGFRIIVRPPAAESTPPDFRAVQIGFLVTGVDEHWARLEPVARVIEPINTSEATAERAFLIGDPNGISYRLVELLS